jgi:hypothetical protein
VESTAGAGPHGLVLVVVSNQAKRGWLGGLVCSGAVAAVGPGCLGGGSEADRCESIRCIELRGRRFGRRSRSFSVIWAGWLAAGIRSAFFREPFLEPRQ